MEKNYILGIDTSCDETSMAVLDASGSVLSNVISSQIKIHANYGGIVPELASRAHIENITAVYQKVLADAGIQESQLSALAVTNTPGLIGCLLVGASFAKALSHRLDIPLYGVNHLEGHLFSPFIAEKILYPFLGLVVSGGHTAFYHVAAPDKIEILGQTVDDAAGEAFDKCAKLLGLGYPGGPVVDKLARDGDENAYPFTIARVKMGERYLSFSGLKTALHHHTQKIEEELSGQIAHDLCASVQKGIVDALIKKMSYFLNGGEFKAFALSGGVAMNSRLRTEVQKNCEQHAVPCFIAAPAYCTDNGAMIAYASLLGKKEDARQTLSVKPSQKLQIRKLKHEKVNT